MKLKHLVLGVSLALSSQFALASTPESAAFAEKGIVADMTQMSEAAAKQYAQAMVDFIKASDNKEALIQDLMANNKDKANVIYTAAIAAGLSEDFVVASALSAGVDPAVMLESTAFFFGFFPFPSAPPPPPPPPPAAPIGGGSGGGGVTISTN